MGIAKIAPFISFILGTIIGSFLNVCIYRLPRKESVVSPPSHCRSCDSRIAWYDNVPIVSWLVLRGKCRGCGSPISIEYPIVEFVTGLIYLFTYLRYGQSPYLVIYLLLFSAFLVIAIIDFKHQIIPDMITLPGTAIGIAAPFFLNYMTPKASIIGLLVGGGLFFLIALLSRGGMGGGDIKLMAMIGTFVGWPGVLVTTMIGSLLGAIVGIALMIMGKKGRKSQIPFGPFLIIGATVYILWGGYIIRWYLYSI
ncbi:MAG: prepilin peptidase [Nitrospinota bacterium]|nr:prepilin peptidase [Nitrospinota bacterium]